MELFVKCSLTAHPREVAVWGAQTPYLLTAPQSQENTWLGFTQPGCWCVGRFLVAFTLGSHLPAPPPACSGAPNRARL